MVSYKYTALTADGTKVNGVVEGLNKIQAAESIKARFPVIVDLEEVKTGGAIDIMNMDVGKVFDDKTLSVMCSQFQIILNSGIVIDDCVRMVASQTTKKNVKAMLLKAADDISQGSSIARAFEVNCKGMPVTFIETVRAGEKSGTLEHSFETLKDYYEKSFKSAQKVKSAMTYPLFVVIVAVIVLAVVMIKVIPTLTAVFKDMGGELPGLTKITIAVSNFFVHNWIVVFLIIFILFAAFYIWSHTAAGKLVWSKLLLRMPVFGKINTLSGSAQFADTMRAMLQSGLVATEALEVTSRVMNNYALSRDVHRMAEEVMTGSSLKSAVTKSELFPDILKQMVGVGEESGEIEKTLETISLYYNNECDYATTQALAKLEPTMMVLLAIFAGFIVISIYLPMFTMYNLY